MKRRRALQPSVQSLEDRAVPSLSFGNLMHSIFPFIHSGTSTHAKSTSQMTAAERSHLVQSRWDARTTAATSTSTSTQIHQLPAANIHTSALQRFLDRHQVAQPNSATSVK